MRIDWLKAPDRSAGYGLALFRLFLGVTLMYGTWDNVVSQERMLEFRDFLGANGFPYPLFCAYLSAYAQFSCGLAIALGFATRAAAAVMAVNFVVALAMVHVRLPFSANIAPLAMLFGSLLLLLDGGGRFAFDAVRGSPERTAGYGDGGIPLRRPASSDTVPTGRL